MRTKIAMILIIALGAMVKVSAQMDTSIILSKNTSQISFVVKTLEKHDTVFAGKDSCTIIATSKYDTIKRYVIAPNAKSHLMNSLPCRGCSEYYLIDSICFSLLHSANGKIYLQDSLVPRWTHIFGTDTYLKKGLEVKNGIIFLFTEKSYAKWTKPNLLNFALTVFWVFILLFFFSPQKPGRKKESTWMILITSVVVAVVSYGLSRVINLSDNVTTSFDSLCWALFVAIPIFLTIFVKKRKNKKKEKVNQGYNEV